MRKIFNLRLGLFILIMVWKVKLTEGYTPKWYCCGQQPPEARANNPKSLVFNNAQADPLFSECKKYTMLWSFTICIIDEDVLLHPEKIDHVANVLAQIIDSDYDG